MKGTAVLIWSHQLGPLSLSKMECFPGLLIITHNLFRHIATLFTCLPILSNDYDN